MSGPVSSQDFKISCFQHTSFLHAGANSGKLKVDSMILGWAWSKMAVAFQFMIPENLLYLENEYMN